MDEDLPEVWAGIVLHENDLRCDGPCRRYFKKGETYYVDEDNFQYCGECLDAE